MPVGGMAFYGQNQHPRITTNFLNQLHRHGDPAPGVPVSTAQVSGSIVQPYGGFEGGKLTITNPWADSFADPAVGPLFGGIYMYVQLNPLETAPLARGQIVFWLDELNYVITAVGLGTGGVPNKIAGVALNQTSPGFWDFIQIAGIASVLFTTAGAIGNPATVTPTATPPATVAPGTTVDQNFIGIAVLTPPAASAVSPVQLNLQVGLNF